MKKQFTTAAQITIAGREHYDDDQASKFLNFKVWEKGGKRRIYITDYKRRTVGYIDCITGEYVEQDNQGLTAQQVAGTVAAFMDAYEF